MIAPIGLLAGPTATVAGAGIIAALIATLVAFRKKIPHPTEFWVVGYWFRLFGWHDHDAFELIIDVHEATNIGASSKAYVHVKAGRFEAQTTTEAAVPGSNKVPFYQRVQIHVRQKEKFITLTLFRTVSASEVFYSPARSLTRPYHCVCTRWLKHTDECAIVGR